MPTSTPGPRTSPPSNDGRPGKSWDCRSGRLRWLTPDEATKLLTKCGQQKHPALVDLVELALYTRMRQGELLELT